MRSASRLSSLVLPVVLLASFDALAHDIRLPVAADELAVLSTGPGSVRYEFTFTDQGPILLNHDPRVDATGVLVYGTGVNGGSTGLLELPGNGWTAILDPMDGVTITGYTYADPGGTGITSITLTQGDLHVVGDIATWPWTPTGSVDELWFHFLIEEEWLCAVGDAATATEITNQTGRVWFLDTTAPFSCPDQVCGNQIRETGEACDDGNLVDDDGCSNDCQSITCETPDFDSTYEGIQSVIFDSATYQCTNAICHNPAAPGPPQADLDLTAGVSYGQLVNTPSSQASLATGEPVILDRVEPGEPIASFLYEKLRAGTLGTPTTGQEMPFDPFPALVPEHLEVIEKWIRAGAPEDLVVENTAALLGVCLPPEDPLKLDPPPDYPPQDEGVQLRSTAWPLLAESEDEICFATYYDLTQTTLVPEADQLDCTGNFGSEESPLSFDANNPSGKCFYYDRRVLRQDAQSHHSIIQIYAGESGLLDPDANFGPFTYKPNYPNEPGALMGPCDPTAIDPATGSHNECSGVIVSGVACTGFGPTDVFAAPSFAGSQEPFVENAFVEGVYSILPMSGVIIWNSHAFNLTESDSTMAHYLDVFFGEENDRDFPAQGIFDQDKIFVQQVPPFETREYCKTFTVAEDTNLFELTSHTHRWGTRFRIWEPPNVPCNPGGFNVFSCEDSCACGPGDPNQLLYFSTEYTDPVQLEFDPPRTFGEGVNDRTFLWCSLYDNGSTPDSPPVKQQSTSPTSPPFQFGPLLLEVGGPCPDVDEPYLNGLAGTHPGVMCMDGPNRGEKCGAEANPAQFCETSPGANDGECDACTVMGGFTTEDEMFILIGTYFIPEPGGTALVGAALVTLALLRRRRGRRRQEGRSAHSAHSAHSA